MFPPDQFSIVVPYVRVSDAMIKMSGVGHGCVAVVDDEESMALAGVFTDGDLRRGLIREGDSFFVRPVGAVMTARPRFTDPSRNASEVMREMRDEKHGVPVMFLPVVENGRLIGLCMLNTLVSLGL